MVEDPCQLACPRRPARARISLQFGLVAAAMADFVFPQLNRDHWPRAIPEFLMVRITYASPVKRPPRPINYQAPCPTSQSRRYIERIGEHVLLSIANPGRPMNFLTAVRSDVCLPGNYFIQVTRDWNGTLAHGART